MQPYWKFLLILGLACFTAEAQTVYLECPDIPTDLPTGGTTFTQRQIVRNDAGSYAVEVSLPLTFGGAPPTYDAVHQLAPGEWLVSLEDGKSFRCPSVPFALPPWDPREVLLWNGACVNNRMFTAYAPFNGAKELIPTNSNVDAVFVDPSGHVVVSFDDTTTIGSITYDKADLVRYDGIKFDEVPYFDASIAGIPIQGNLTAADRRGLLTVFSLEDVTAVGTSDIHPGELISWNGSTLAVFDPQPGWPENLSSRVNALTFEATAPATAPGNIGASLMVDLQDGALRLSWAASDCAGGGNVAVYQGNLASLPTYDHTQIDCDDAFPYLSEVVQLMPPGDAYFLVVARTAVPPGGGEEGSYGLDHVGSAMTERPVGSGTCAPVQALGCL